jgi:SH3 domain-containing YSC84-like protein 1
MQPNGCSCPGYSAVPMAGDASQAIDLRVEVVQKEVCPLGLRKRLSVTSFFVGSKTRARYTVFMAAGAIILLLASVVWAADDKDKDESDIAKRIDASANVLNEIMGTPDKAIPDKIMGDAKCLVIIPSMVKIAVGFGGNHGRGIATCKTANGWSAPAPVTITGGSWGLQLGGQAIDIIMVVMNDQGVEHLLSSNFKLGAEASAAAGPVGRDAGADTDWKLKAEVLTYSRARGLFAGVDINGAAITQDKDATRLLYTKMIPFGDILRGKVSPPEGSHALLSALRKYSEQARNHQGE